MSGLGAFQWAPSSGPPANPFQPSGIHFRRFNLFLSATNGLPNRTPSILIVKRLREYFGKNILIFFN
jgi:hypothetical protein